MKKTIFILLLIMHLSLDIAPPFASRFIGKHCSAQWVLQTTPINCESSALVFFDVNTGVMASWNNNIGYVLRTTNSGFNWVVMNSMTGSGVHSLQKIDSTTIYGKGGNNGYLAIYRTYDRGLTWDSVSKQNSLAIASIYFIDRDTGWYSAFAIPSYTIWKTTNGGVNMFQISVTGGAYGNMFFLKEKVNGQYWGWVAADGIYRTMNGGINWYNAANLQVNNGGNICFINKDTGWVGSVYPGGGNPYRIYVTYNGGQNWTWQQMPNAPNFFSNGANLLKCINKNILYGGGGIINFNGRLFALIWKTTNGGINWGYQLPDTSFYFGGPRACDFIDSTTGWVYYGTNGLYTTNGGGPIIYTRINQQATNVSSNFILYQNYPNPFNQCTIINFQCTKKSYLKIKIFDIMGKEIETLVNEKKSPGNYEVRFNGEELSSGIYFYSLYADGERVGTKRMVLIK